MEVYGFDRERAERLKAIADSPRVINQLQLPRKRQPSGSGSPVRLFLTPSGGIAARGSAVCTEYAEDLLTSLGNTETVWNHRSSVVAGGVLVLVMQGLTKLWVVEGNCPIEITEPSEGGGGPILEP